MKKLVVLLTLIASLGFVLASCSNSNTTKTGQLALDETYTCTMHNEVMSDKPGECPKCGMHLVKQKMTAEQQKKKNEGTYTKPKE